MEEVPVLMLLPATTLALPSCNEKFIICLLDLDCNTLSPRPGRPMVLP